MTDATARAGTSTDRQAVRGVKTLDFAGTKETVYERADWPTEKLTE
jgi:ketol-acid reductoisomerase